MYVHDDEDAIVEVPKVVSKVNQIPNNEALDQIENKMDNPLNDVPRDYRIFHGHLKDQILGRATTLVHTLSLQHMY